MRLAEHGGKGDGEQFATQLVGEPITANLVLGLIAVFTGIWIATSQKP